MKNNIQDTIKCLISSCEEGISGDWNCSKEGFEAMITQLEWLNSWTNALQTENKDREELNYKLQQEINDMYHSVDDNFYIL